MLFTIEPMINLGRAHVKVLSDGWTAVTRDRSLSAQFEHTVGVTSDGVRGVHDLAGRPAQAAIRLKRPLAARRLQIPLFRAHAEPSGSRMPPKRNSGRNLAEAPPHYHGHRERLRARFMEAGARGARRLRDAGAGALPRGAAARREAAREGACLRSSARLPKSSRRRRAPRRSRRARRSGSHGIQDRAGGGASARARSAGEAAGAVLMVRR